MCIAPSSRVIYLTGASGFLGGYIARVLQTDDDVAKIYCPIREKKGVCGIERMKKILPYDKCTHLGLDDPLPHDVTHVILNAYSTRFDEGIRKKLVDNVVPIMRILDECSARCTIQGITLVSTAFVQPPLPYTKKELNRLPFLLDSKVRISPRRLYESILEHDNVMELVPDLPQYYQENSYVFSKHILEHLMAEKYSDLPICIVRPSLIFPPRSMDYGLNTKSAVPLLLALGSNPVMLAPINDGKGNMVAMEDVTQDVLDGVFHTAMPAMQDEVTGWPWHPIVSSTGTDAKLLDMFAAGAPNIPRFDIKRAWLRNAVREFEFLMAMAFFGRKASGLLRAVYENYDAFSKHTWDYQVRYHDDWIQLVLDNKQTYYERSLHKKADVHQNWDGYIQFAKWLSILMVVYVVIMTEWNAGPVSLSHEGLVTTESASAFYFAYIMGTKED